MLNIISNIIDKKRIEIVSNYLFVFQIDQHIAHKNIAKLTLKQFKI